MENLLVVVLSEKKWLASFFLYMDKNEFMKLALYIMAVLLTAVWIIGFFIFSAGMIIHIFMIAAALFLMQAIIINPKPQQERYPVEE